MSTCLTPRSSVPSYRDRVRANSDWAEVILPWSIRVSARGGEGNEARSDKRQ